MSGIAQFATDELGLRLTPMQERAVGEFEDGHQQAVWCIGRRGGKALALDTPIPTPYGWTTMAALRPGDVVLDDQGSETIVTGCSEVMERPVYRVRFSDDSEIVADGDHLWTTLDHNARKALNRYGQPIPVRWWEYSSPGRGGQHAGARTLTTLQLARTIGYGKRGDTSHAIPAAQSLKGTPMLFAIDPYVLGCWLGDGNTGGAGFTCADEQIVDEIRKAAYIVERKECAPYRYAIRGLARELRRHGLLGDKHIPDQYLRASVDQRIALLQGLMDTDGYANAAKCGCEFTTTRWRLAEGVYELAVSLGLVVRIFRGVATLDGRSIGPKWRVCFNPWFIPFRLARKVERVRQRLAGRRQGLRKLRYIESIDACGTAQVKCISVSSASKLYLAGRSMIPTHNSTVADVLALYDAMVRDELREKMLPGEWRVSAIVCPRLDQAQSHIQNIGARLAASKRIGKMVLAQTAEEITFRNGSSIRAFPCSARGIRGGAWSSCVLDEFGHFLTSEEGNAAGDRVLEAALPSLAQFGDAGWLVCISTPLWKSGAFWKLCQRASSGQFPYIQWLHASTAEMNPAIPPAWLEQRRQEDPDMYRREFMAEFVDGTSAFLSSTDVLACQRLTGTNAPRDGLSYVAAIDPAFSRDLFALGVAHRERELIVLDGVWTWHREGFEGTLDQVEAVLARYRCKSVRTDQFSAQAVMEGLGRRGVHCEVVAWEVTGKWNAYARMKALINTRGLELPKDEQLAQELMSLEAKGLPSGNVRISAAGGGHDDRASVLAALVDQLEGPRATVEALLQVWASYEPEAAETWRQEKADPRVW